MPYPFTASPSCLHFHPTAFLLRPSLYYLPSFGVLCRRRLSTFSDRLFSLICVFMYYTSCSDLLHTTFLTLCSDLITALFFYFLVHLLSLSVMFSFRSDLPRSSPLDFAPLCSNLIIPIISVCYNTISTYLIFSTLITMIIL